MVIQCSSCDTRFKIADDKVKASGVKVRCSKCKEVFTVLPPEKDQAATEKTEVEAAANSESSAGDFNDLNASFSADPEQEGSEEPSAGLDDVDWGSLNSDETDESSAEVSSSDFSFGDEETSLPDDTSLVDDESVDAATDDFSFDEPETSEPAVEEESAFSFGGDSASDDADLGLDEPVGEGAQDEFSFDDAPAATDDADDFDWDGSSSDDTADDDDSFGFGESAQSDDNLDFSSLGMPEDEEAAPLEVEAPPVETTPTMPVMDEARPASVKGPQKGGAKGRGVKRGKKTKKQSGPLRSTLTLLFLLSLIIGGGLYGLKQMGFWSGDFAELQDVDYVTAGLTAWDKAMVEANRLAGNEVVLQPVGSIAVTEISGKYIQNDQAGTLFVIEGKIRNDYTSNRSAIAVRGILYDTAGSPVNQLKVFCGNSVDDKTLRTEKLEAIQQRGNNEFGDSLSNLDVTPGAFLPFTIVFNNLPENLSEYNVVPAESAAGAKQ